jgi:hypothetical protein
MSTPATATQQAIMDTCQWIATFLVAKNTAYGDSALAPVRIFSRASSTEQLLVRIDDKLSRIQRTGLESPDGEDVILDLIGYLILLRIAQSPQEGEKSGRNP